MDGKEITLAPESVVCPQCGRPINRGKSLAEVPPRDGNDMNKIRWHEAVQRVLIPSLRDAAKQGLIDISKEALAKPYVIEGHPPRGIPYVRAIRSLKPEILEALRRDPLRPRRWLQAHPRWTPCRRCALMLNLLRDDEDQTPPFNGAPQGYPGL